MADGVDDLKKAVKDLGMSSPLGQMARGMEKLGSKAQQTFEAAKTKAGVLLGDLGYGKVVQTPQGTTRGTAPRRKKKKPTDADPDAY